MQGEVIAFIRSTDIIGRNAQKFRQQILLTPGTWQTVGLFLSQIISVWLLKDTVSVHRVS